MSNLTINNQVQIFRAFIFGGITALALVLGAIQPASATVTASDGTLDLTFGNGGTGFTSNGAPGRIRQHVVQSDNKIVVVGDFNSYNGEAVSGIVRLNSDGTRDTSFISAGPATLINGVAVQSDGKYVVVGGFSSFNGVTSQAIVRLNQDGSVDSSFTAPLFDGPTPYAQRVAVQGDGSIVVVGDFTSVGGTSAGRIAKLSSTGVFDASFNINLGSGANGVARRVQPLANGKILVSGSFPSFSSTSVSGVVLLNSDGSRDTSFTFHEAGASWALLEFAVQSDNKVLVGGRSSTSGVSTPRLVRLNTDGTVDTSFNAGLVGSTDTASVNGLAVAADGSIYVGGDQLSTYNGAEVEELFRLSSAGLLDPNFSSGSVLRGSSFIEFNSISVLSNGDVLISGFFTSYNGTSVGSIARITNVASGSSGGSAPSPAPGGAVPLVAEAPTLAATGASSSSGFLIAFGVTTALGVLLIAQSRRLRRQ